MPTPEHKLSRPGDAAASRDTGLIPDERQHRLPGSEHWPVGLSPRLLQAYAHFRATRVLAPAFGPKLT